MTERVDARMQEVECVSLGTWQGPVESVSFDPVDARLLRETLRQPLHLVHDPRSRRIGVAVGVHQAGEGWPLLSTVAPVYPEWLGERAFTAAHGLRFAYMGGSMARGIASTDLVIALARMGALGMFGSAGLAPDRVAAAIDRMAAALDHAGLPWGCNLIHSPNEPSLEQQLVDLYLARDVRRVEASAFMTLSRPLVQYACSGLARGPDGTVRRRNHLFAKVSREEVARHFLAPPPAAMLDALVAEERLTTDEASLAREVPLAEQLIVESDSGGHTDNRPLNALFPVIAALRDEFCARHGYRRPIHLGAAGGLGTPQAVAAAFSLGAAFVVLGSVHQATVESGLSADGRAMLAQAGVADVAMTASADMFELGVKVQVLARGTMMPVRGNRLYDLYRRHASLEALPEPVRRELEEQVFRLPLDQVWRQTEDFFTVADPSQLERAARDARHRMALVFRWYLGKSSHWPIAGETDRRVDYQIWCGPAMGAFNRWVADSFLAEADRRVVRQVALNLLEGAAQVTRAQQLRCQGVEVHPAATRCPPMPLELQDVSHAA